MKVQATYLFVHPDNTRVEITLVGTGGDIQQASEDIQSKVGRLIRDKEVDGHRVENVAHYNLVGKMKVIG